MMLPYVGVTINILSLFAFILVLGIVGATPLSSVRARIVKLKSGYTVEYYRRNSEGGCAATFGVLTTVMAFLPMLSLPVNPAQSPKLLDSLLYFACCSLWSASLSLPSHLALAGPPKSRRAA